jgi:2-polyprenyl-3-methyl-5-hydroxy-6-metoxy-1,4-benzoquinol methylase
MTRSRTATVERTLADRRVHDGWDTVYRTFENERFYALAFDEVARAVALPPGAAWLDAGCGPGFHAIRLAERGHRVTAVDFSPAALEEARRNVVARGVADRVAVRREDLLDLTFADGSFDAVLCWGVLMHVPDVVRAVDELARVVAPGGRLVVSERNMLAAEAAAPAIARRVFGHGRRQRRTPAGIEHWKQTDAGPFLIRHANVGWLVRAFAERGLVLRRRMAGQLTESYGKLPQSAARVVHDVNARWVRGQRPPSPAVANILVLEKPPAGSSPA